MVITLGTGGHSTPLQRGVAIVLHLMSKSRIPLAQGKFHFRLLTVHMSFISNCVDLGTLSKPHTLRIIGGRRLERRDIKSAGVCADGLLLLRFERGSL